MIGILLAAIPTALAAGSALNKAVGAAEKGLGYLADRECAEWTQDSVERANRRVNQLLENEDFVDDVLRQQRHEQQYRKSLKLRTAEARSLFFNGDDAFTTRVVPPIGDVLVSDVEMKVLEALTEKHGDHGHPWNDWNQSNIVLILARIWILQDARRSRTKKTNISRKSGHTTRGRNYAIGSNENRCPRCGTQYPGGVVWCKHCEVGL